MIRTHFLLYCAIGLACACSEPPPPVESPPPDPWSDEQEVIYQTEQVILYEEEKFRLEQERLQSLGISPPDGDAQRQAEQEQQGESPPAHEGG